MTYDVFGGTLSLTQSINQSVTETVMCCWTWGKMHVGMSADTSALHNVWSHHVLLWLLGTTAWEAEWGTQHSAVINSGQATVRGKWTTTAASQGENQDSRGEELPRTRAGCCAQVTRCHSQWESKERYAVFMHVLLLLWSHVSQHLVCHSWCDVMWCVSFIAFIHQKTYNETQKYTMNKKAKIQKC